MSARPTRQTQAHKRAAPRKAPRRRGATPDTAPDFDDLPDTALARQAQLVWNPARPKTPTPLPFSASTMWRRVKSGQFPAPVRVSPGVTAWRVADIRAWLTQAGADQGSAQA